MAMKFDELEAQALKLPEEWRVKLLQRLLRSLEEGVGEPAEVAEAWLEEARRRDEEMDSGKEAGIPAEEVFRRLRTESE